MTMTQSFWHFVSWTERKTIYLQNRPKPTFHTPTIQSQVISFPSFSLIRLGSMKYTYFWTDEHEGVERHAFYEIILLHLLKNNKSIYYAWLSHWAWYRKYQMYSFYVRWKVESSISILLYNISQHHHFHPFIPTCDSFLPIFYLYFSLVAFNSNTIDPRFNKVIKLMPFLFHLWPSNKRWVICWSKIYYGEVTLGRNHDAFLLSNLANNNNAKQAHDMKDETWLIHLYLILPTNIHHHFRTNLAMEYLDRDFGSYVCMK
jgi:hypothetical protein